MIEVNRDNFAQEVEKAGGLVMVDFWGPSCQPCLRLMPAVEKLADSYKDKLKVAKVDSSKNRRLCINLRVMALPTFLFYRDGKEVGRISGEEVNSRQLAELLDSYLG